MEKRSQHAASKGAVIGGALGAVVCGSLATMLTFVSTDLHGGGQYPEFTTVAVFLGCGAFFGLLGGIVLGMVGGLLVARLGKAGQSTSSQSGEFRCISR